MPSTPAESDVKPKRYSVEVRRALAKQGLPEYIASRERRRVAVQAHAVIDAARKLADQRRRDGVKSDYRPKAPEECPFLSFDDINTRPTHYFEYEPLAATPDPVISDARVRDLLPVLEARTLDAVWGGRVEDADQLLIWWKYWRGVESGKIQRPLPKSRRPITLPILDD